MPYKHIFCECGGIIGMYDKEKFVCSKCGKPYLLHEIDYDRLLINDKTDWAFPMKERKEGTATSAGVGRI